MKDRKLIMHPLLAGIPLRGRGTRVVGLWSEQMLASPIRGLKSGRTCNMERESVIVLGVSSWFILKTEHLVHSNSAVYKYK